MHTILLYTLMDVQTQLYDVSKKAWVAKKARSPPQMLLEPPIQAGIFVKLQSCHVGGTLLGRNTILAQRATTQQAITRQQGHDE